MSKKTGVGAERDRAQRAAETADQRSRFTAEKYVKEGGTKPPRRNEVTADERQTGS